MATTSFDIPEPTDIIRITDNGVIRLYHPSGGYSIIGHVNGAYESSQVDFVAASRALVKGYLGAWLDLTFGHE